MNADHVPLATYRIPLRSGLDFASIRALAPHLRRLGISHVYQPPVTTARRGSAHGYDVVDPNRIDESLGSLADYHALLDDLKAHGLGTILDVVPDHMAATLENPWWRDVLAHGRNSQFARFFDIDWDPGPPELRGRVYLPVLDRPLPRAIADGKVRIEVGPQPTVRVGQHRLPVASRTAARLLKKPHEQGKKTVTRLSQPEPDLVQVLEEQHYLLGPWQDAPFRVNYRRFFDVNDLVSIRAEDPLVFEETHRLLASLVREGRIDGLRIDHLDGLADPLEYLTDLRRHVTGDGRYLLIEKILGPDERLRHDWPVEGTTGYEFADRLNRLFVAPEGLRKLGSAYRDWVGHDTTYLDLLFEQKRRVLLELFPGAFQRLAHDLAVLLAQEGLGDAARPEGVFDALVELTCALRVYRTYVRDGPVAVEDRIELERAMQDAVARGRASGLLLRAIVSTFQMRVDDGVFERTLRLVQRWQQLTGPIMAKGHEDTALYLHHRLSALNDVGSDPEAPPLSPADLHAFNAHRADAWPHTLNSTSTHDIKRSEDVRARMLVLSEVPTAWLDHARRWRELNADLRSQVGTRTSPTPNLEYLYYQTIVGVWPLDAGQKADLPRRLRSYMVKAAREGKRQTNWIRPDDEFEQALTRFVDASFDNHPFIADVEALVGHIGLAGSLNSLSMNLLKCTSPGVPDIYRGCETWDLSLVDPDNRRPVDLAAIGSRLEDLDADFAQGAATAPRLLHAWRDGRVKLFLLSRALRMRAEIPNAFRGGAYEPVRLTGPRADKAVAFLRHGGGDAALVVAPRLVAADVVAGELPLDAYWEGTYATVPAGHRWRSAFSDEEWTVDGDRFPLETLLKDFPFGLVRRL